ncbi:alternate-type signal peptide domain-containing protein [Gryllotalpicola protaetiae]|uniref:Alternate-type signal peptide domain-containing protein n=1 Tax=Gryllotalpicola protaetiae TaxID=2419771 RepID=A0A387BT98_9MICO|nr:alternate-type signal peptide domain-containing protein [Gryllotalpicola protaetiae]AYG04167.1 alternate-type signal peptide domain-containing protein [Gryllotalpicola protaetiae]
MNKLIKGAVAGAAGIALLLGGAGTFAAWNSSKTATPGTGVQTGHLSIDAATADGWYSDSSLTSGVDTANFHAVPGDTLYYKATATIAATGDNLAAKIGVDPTTLGATLGNKGATGTVTASVLKVTGTGITDDNGVYSFDATGSDIIATVVIEVDFPFGDDTENTLADGQGASISLNPIDITLTQIEKTA